MIYSLIFSKTRGLWDFPDHAVSKVTKESAVSLASLDKKEKGELKVSRVTWERRETEEARAPRELLERKDPKEPRAGNKKLGQYVVLLLGLGMQI
jgi:hypothetical protein